MKISNFRVISLLLLLCLLFSLQVNAQVGINTLSPDASSMLDIQSTTKGVLIPRMLGSERTAIASPANGLLVFDTTSKSFWYYNGTATTPAWKELVTGSLIVDTDGDTRVEVEKVLPDVDTDPNSDAINFTTRDVERMKIDAAGVTKIGVDLAAQATTYVEVGADGVLKLGNKGASTLTGGPDNGVESDATGLENYTKITADGSLSYVGNATRWEDFKVPVNSVKIKDADIDRVKYKQFVGGLVLLEFEEESTKEVSVMFTVQMPHGWKEGTNIYPHVHWTSQSNIADGQVTWGLEYQWADVGGNYTNGTGTIITGSTIAPPNTPSGVTAYEHVITPLGTGGMDATGKELSSMILCRLYRDPNDNYNGDDVFLLEIDFHYQVDSDGSNQEYTKQ